MSCYRILLLTSLVVVFLDQVTKWYIDTYFVLHETIPVVEGFFSITYVRNKGAAFGLLANSSFRTPFFIFVTLAAVVGILWYLHRTRKQQKLLQCSLSLIFAGAVGNLIDRIRMGEVIDFLDVFWRQYHWPAFNVADSAITVGVALLLIDTWREERRHKKSSE